MRAPDRLSRRQLLSAAGAAALIATLAGCALESAGSGRPSSPSLSPTPRRTTDSGARLADAAAAIVAALRQTDYQHEERIDAAAGRYDCDCNGFVGLLLASVAPAAYAELPKEADQPRPRAFEYARHFAALPTSGSAAWLPVERLDRVRRGDVVAWRFATVEAGRDTGHVMIAGGAATAAGDGSRSLRVFDSADAAHFDDTRGAGRFPNGVGSGAIRFRVDGGGRPSEFLFSPGGRFTALPISMARLRA